MFFKDFAIMFVLFVTIGSTFGLCMALIGMAAEKTGEWA